jgi:hypothetical protein
MDDELNHRFTYHAPRDAEQIETYRQVRAAGLTLARAIARSAPECEERKVALNQVDAAVMWANAAIARRT